MRISDWSSDVCSSDLVFVIVMGLATTGVLRVPFFYRERRLDMGRIRPGPAGAVPLGVAFAVGWTPCIGPDRKSVVSGTSVSVRVDLGGSCIIKKKKN